MLRIGTRGSKLALWQAGFVKKELQKKFPDLIVQIQTINTTGDVKINRSLSEIGGKGVFVKEIEEALLSKKIDVAVHSLKDVPSVLPDGLVIGCVLKRDDPRDCLISKSNLRIDELNEYAKIATSSLRRKYQIQSKFPKLRFTPIRGNVDTRIKKLFLGDFEAVVLAVAGLKRLGLQSQISQYFHTDYVVPAPCQGIIGVECRSNDQHAFSFISKINDSNTEIATKLERSFLKAFGGDCSIPLGCYTEVDNGNVNANSVFIDVENNEIYSEKIFGKVDESEALGIQMARVLIQRAKL